VGKRGRSVTVANRRNGGREENTMGGKAEDKDEDALDVGSECDTDKESNLRVLAPVEQDEKGATSALESHGHRVGKNRTTTHQTR
jgi:hypothetical protein